MLMRNPTKKRAKAMYQDLINTFFEEGYDDGVGNIRKELNLVDADIHDIGVRHGHIT